jgi:DNA-binding NarL/FixJ family response regulator
MVTPCIDATKKSCMNLLATPTPEKLYAFRQHLLRKGVLAIVGTLAEYWDCLTEQSPGLILLDLALAGPVWKDIIADTRKMAPAARIVAVADKFPEADELFLLGLGVVGCCNYALPPESVARIIEMVEDGGVWISHAVLPLIMRQLAEKIVVKKQQNGKPLPAPAKEPDSSSLTPREREIARLAGNGASNKLIARELNITDRTVKAHLSAIFQKLGMRDRVHLALYLNGSAPQEQGGLASPR